VQFAIASRVLEAETQENTILFILKIEINQIASIWKIT